MGSLALLCQVPQPTGSCDDVGAGPYACVKPNRPTGGESKALACQACRMQGKWLGQACTKLVTGLGLRVQDKWSSLSPGHTGQVLRAKRKEGWMVPDVFFRPLVLFSKDGMRRV